MRDTIREENRGLVHARNDEEVMSG